MSALAYAGLSAGLQFIFIFVKALQQLNVVNGRYWAVMPCSIAMGICEVATVLLVVRADSLWLGLANGVAAGFGAMLAMYIYSKLKRKEG